MFSLPELRFINNKDQIVPDIDNPLTLEKDFPVIVWNGRSVQIKEMVMIFIKVDDADKYTLEQKSALKKQAMHIIDTVRKSHPAYFKHCLSTF